MAEVDLTLAQYRVLVISSTGSTDPPPGGARLLGVSPSTLTSVVDGLCGRDLVQRLSGSR